MRRLVTTLSVLTLFAGVMSLISSTPARAAVPSPLACVGRAGTINSFGGTVCWLPPDPNVTHSSTWQYQLQGINASGVCDTTDNPGGIDVNVHGTVAGTATDTTPAVFDIDHQIDPSCPQGATFGENMVAVQHLHSKGDKVIGYIDAGSRESFRQDAGVFDAYNASCNGCLYGRTLTGFKNEKWLNINPSRTLPDGSLDPTDAGIDPKDNTTTTTAPREDRQQFILEEMTDRVIGHIGFLNADGRTVTYTTNGVKTAGFDGIEFDVVDGWENNTGLTISASTQLEYNAKLANIAHQNGLTVALKNDVDQIASPLNPPANGDLEPYFDYAINEQCQQFRECDKLAKFLTNKKRVFQVEYKLSTDKFCSQANAGNRDAILKTFDLFAQPWTPCHVRTT